MFNMRLYIDPTVSVELNTNKWLYVLIYAFIVIIYFSIIHPKEKNWTYMY